MIGAAVKAGWCSLFSRSGLTDVSVPAWLSRTFGIMLRNGIAQFVGSVSKSGYHLRIKKADKDRAVVDSLIPALLPFSVPPWGARPH